MVRLRFLVLGVLLSGMVIGGGLFNARASTASASSIGSANTHVDVSIGGFAFEQGARLAVEIVRDDSCACLCDRIDVIEWSLADAGDETLISETYEEAVDLAGWIGRVALVDSEGEPMPEGTYTLRIGTSIGVFSAHFEIVSALSTNGLGHVSASATVCGLGLRIYRLVTLEDQGALLHIRRDDRLMVALEGDATTGYTWANTVLYEYAILRETQEVEYREKMHAPDIVGSGGEYVFLYEAIDVGQQAFRFWYQRPWESVQPAETVEFSVIVY